MKKGISKKYRGFARKKPQSKGLRRYWVYYALGLSSLFDNFGEGAAAGVVAFSLRGVNEFDFGLGVRG